MSTQTNPGIVPIRARIKAFKPQGDSATLIKTAHAVDRMKRHGGRP